MTGSVEQAILGRGVPDALACPARSGYVLIKAGRLMAPRSTAMMENKPKKPAGLIGFGFDNEDGHVRVTQGKNFRVYLGSEETHGRMAEVCIKINEKLDRRGKRLEEVSPRELADLANDAGTS